MFLKFLKMCSLLFISTTKLVVQSEVCYYQKVDN